MWLLSIMLAFCVKEALAVPTYHGIRLLGDREILLVGKTKMIPNSDARFPGTGLLIWHIDESVISSDSADNYEWKGFGLTRAS